MKCYCLSLAALMTLILGTPTILSAEDLAEAADAEKPTTAEAPSIPTPTVDQLQLWAKDLDGNTFAEREAAEAHLLAAGKASIDVLMDAARSKSSEAHSRALRVLKQFLQSPDEATQSAAKEALAKLAASDDPRVARRATAALAPPADRQVRAVPQFIPGRVQIVPGIQGRIQVQGGQIQIAAGAGNVRVVQEQNINGVRKINASEGNTKIQIDEDPNQGITIKVTEKENNQEKVTEYQAKDLDELTKKHPEGRKIYDKYAGKPQAAPQIQVQAVPLPGLPIQVPGVPIPQLPRLDADRDQVRKQALEGIGAARDQLREVIEALKKAQADGNTEQNTKDAFEKIQQQIESAAKKLSETEEKLDR